MSNSTSTVVRTVTAREVRAYFAADPKRVEALPEAARVSVAEGARGRIHPAAVALHNKRRKVAYSTGATKVSVARAKVAAAALRTQAAAAGFTVGDRGPLPKAFLDSLDSE